MQPRIEPEVRSCSGVTWPVGAALHEIAVAVVVVRASLEIVDSVWRDYRFTAEQNTADGSSAAGVVLGTILDVDPLGTVTGSASTLRRRSDVASATGAAAGGHPLHGIAWLCEQLACARFRSSGGATGHHWWSHRRSSAADPAPRARDLRSGRTGDRSAG